ncbi:MAG: endolytic transglycosylase MltG [Gammaproteobacteria bacterium]|nr:endolytic transglycosylase MltG [Gammaproteobacteria bacterium]
MRALRRLLILLLALATLVAGALFYLGRSIGAPGPHAAPVLLDVVPGETLRGVLNDLERAGALRQPRLVEWWARLADRTPRVRVGRYEIAARASARDVLRQLDEGRVVLESITVIEGTRYADLRRALAAHAGVRQTLAGIADEELMRRLGEPGVHPEGRFFPDTYRFAHGTTDFELLRIAHRRMQERLAAAWAARAPNLPLAGPAEALTLASIVEKESALESERPRVAGVFVQRLRLGMRLQSDPTVIYGLGEAYDGDIRNRDLAADTPYNSYTRKGLPPTPIALPGEAALRASTRPLESGELFFVATGMPDGSHTFSRTYEEHRAAVRRMLERQRVESPR